MSEAANFIKGVTVQYPLKGVGKGGGRGETRWGEGAEGGASTLPQTF